MNQVMMDIWPYLIVPIAGLIGWLFREIFVLKTKVAVVEGAIDGLQTTMKSTDENIQKTIEKMQNRLDSHSKKQDDILNRISSMEKEVLGKMGDMTANMASLASDLKNLTNLIAISDAGIKISRK